MKYFYVLLLAGYTAQLVYAPQLTISSPGFYSLDVTRDYNPTINNDPIISIAASDVTLDFQGNTIAQGSNNTQTGIDGISIAAAQSNITIQNARIKNLSGVGIRVSNACSKILITNSIIETCHTGGILLNGTTPGVISTEIAHTRVSTCTGSNGSPAYGIRAINATSLNIHDCIVNQNDASTTSSGYGISIENSQLCALSGNNVIGNGGSGIAAGVSLVACNNILIQNTFSSNNTNHDTTYSGTTYGFDIEQSTNVLILNCRSAANVNTSSFCYGLALQNGQKNVIEKLVSGFNKGTSLAAGILLNNEFQSVVETSAARGNETTVTGTAYGILLTGTCDQCFLDTNQITSNIGTDTTFGILDERNPSTSLMLGNEAFNNGTNFNITYPVGVTFPVTDVSLSEFPGTDNIASGNKYLNINIIP